MTNEFNEIIVGFDLCYDYSMLTFYHQNNTEPMTVTSVPGKEQYQIPTPRDLFPLIEQRAELGVALLSNFFKMCFEKLSSAGPLNHLTVMVTMEKIKPVWAKAIREALEMLDIPRERIYLQDHLESFFYYILNQKKEFWHYKVALFEYEKDRIIGYELSINYRTKPAFVNVIRKNDILLDKKCKNRLKTQEWDRKRDQMFLSQAKKLMGDGTYSSVYLCGEKFDKEWMPGALGFLCQKRRVFQGNNLYTKGACYGAMNQTGASPIGNFLYNGPDMIEYNVVMKMLVRGKEEYRTMITAGVNYYMAWSECEFILDGTEEIVLYSKSIKGEKMSHVIQLTDLPKRPNRATRIHMELSFQAKNRCRVHLEDLGLGELYKSSGKKWEAVIEL